MLYIYEHNILWVPAFIRGILGHPELRMKHRLIQKENCGKKPCIKFTCSWYYACK